MRTTLRAARIAALVVAWTMALVAGIVPARAMTILPLDLPAMTGQAARIFVGRVEHIEAGRDAGGLPATWTTFAVTERVKGAVGDTLTVKQLGTSLAGPNGRVLPHPALPRYRVGESVVLFLQPESPLGFTSPVGLGQGCFRIRTDHGTSVAENDIGNRNLEPAGARAGTRAAAPPTADAVTPLALDALLTRVRGLVAEER